MLVALLKKIVERYSSNIPANVREVYRRLFVSGIMLLLVLSIGTIGYKLLVPESSWFDGLYMTAITISTIGYGEIVDLTHNTSARIFTIFVAFSGIGIITYFLSNIATLLVEGNIQHSLNIRRMEKKIASLSGHYIICGMDRIGLNIAEELKKTQQVFVFADSDAQKIEQYRTHHPNMFCLTGDCTDEDFLNQLGLPQAKGLFVATADDNTNIVICVAAKQVNSTVRIIATCKENTNIKKLTTVGAEKVISPNFIGGLRMASEMIRPSVTTFLDTMMRDQNQNLRIEDIALSSSFFYQKLAELNIEKFEKTLLMAIKEQNNWIFNPKKEHLIQPNSVLIVMTTPEERKILEKMYCY